MLPVQKSRWDAILSLQEAMNFLCYAALPQSFQNDAKYDADIQPEDSEKVVLSV
jgi:hypothetical protein